MNSKTSSTGLNLVIVIAILLVLNYIVSALPVLNFRADLTEKNIYTLSEGSKHILAGLDPNKPMVIRYYVSEETPQQGFKAYARTVQDLLLEIEKQSDDKVKLEKIDPRPSTDDEDRAVADDIQGFQMNEMGEKGYFGLAIQCLDKKEVIPALGQVEETNLEYQILRAIAKVSKGKREVVGVMCPMPIANPPFNFPGMPQRQQPPWVVMQQLRQDYDMREVPMSSDKIDADVNVLLIVHPYGISEKTEFAIDQFLLRGGKVVAFVDPHCLVSKAYDNPGQPGMMPTTVTSPTSDLPKLLSGWGVRYDKTKVVADMTYRSASWGDVPTFLEVPREGINRSEPVTSPLELIQVFSSGSFSYEKKEAIDYLTLVESSENSELIDFTQAEDASRGKLKSFGSDGKKKILATRLSGKFKTAFPEGPPKEKAPGEGAPKLPGESGGEDKKDAGAPATTPEKEKAEAPASLKDGDGKGIVFLFADADMEYDMFALVRDQSGRGVLPIAANSNIPMLLNIVEMLTGGSDLIHVRSRAVVKRPFTKMQELQSTVEAKYRPLVEKKQQERDKIVEEIANKGGLKQDNRGGGILRLNQKELQELRDKQVAIQKDIRDAQKEMNREKNHRQMIITVLNIVGLPLLLVAFGITLALRRSSLRAAH